MKAVYYPGDRGLRIIGEDGRCWRSWAEVPYYEDFNLYPPVARFLAGGALRVRFLMVCIMPADKIY